MDFRPHTPMPSMRGWTSGLVALAVHAGLVLAMPAAEAERPVSPAQPVWLSLSGPVQSGPAEDGAEGASGLEATPAGDRKGPQPQAQRVPESAPAPLAQARQRRHRPARSAHPRRPCGRAPASSTSGTPVAAETTPAEALAEAAPGSTDEAAQTGSSAEPGGPSGAAQGQAALAGEVGEGPGAAGRGATTGDSARHGPRLASRTPCAGYFPVSAEVSRGTVRLAVHVAPDGHPDAARVLAEAPRGQGFGSAATACALRQLHFDPATDGRGLQVDGEAELKLAFARM